MSVIRILSDHLANQIAAGEVVERPASVIKELVENSLDAGATRILVQVEGGGTRLLRVVDNGMGMNGDDVLLCLERHATSKLAKEEQLTAIATLGFRGEALASIGSVARLTIISRLHGQPTGTRAEIRYGILHGVHEDGCSPGTIVEVRNLFAKTPARKKFLKSGRTELFHIEEVIKNQALAYGEVTFTLEIDGRLALEYPAVIELEERVRAVFRYQGQFLDLTGDSGGKDDDPGLDEIGVSGFLLLPESVASSRAKLRLLVNGRAVQDRMLRHAVLEGLHGFLMKGYSPAGVVILNLSPAEVDVNVHPAKREVKFRRSQEIHRFMVLMVRAAVRVHQERIRAEIFSVQQDRDRPGTNRYAGEDGEIKIPGDGEHDRFDSRSYSDAILLAPGEPTAKIPNNASLISREPEPVKNVLAKQGYAPEPVLETIYPELTENPEKLTLIGQIFDLYLLCTRAGRLIVIDQHAAHERILYTKLVDAYIDGNVLSQTLLFPVTVDLPPDQAESAQQGLEELASLGVQAEPFGEDTWIIKAVPALLAKAAPEDIFFQSIEALQTVNRKEGALPTAINELFARTACRAAIKGGDHLTPLEILALLEQMEKSEIFSHCPHGRPVFKIFSKAEIEKWFHRS